MRSYYLIAMECKMGDNYDSSYEIQCPQCKGTKYRNPQMKLMVNVCGHPLCDSCVKIYFIHESASCPECEMVLKRTKFRVQIFEDPLVEKEIDIRRKVMRTYNMCEEDFEDPEQWNQYLEEIEDIVYNLTNNINRSETESKMEKYERQHKEEIRKNFTRKSREMEELEKHLDEEMLRGLRRKKILQEEEESTKMARVRNKDSLIQDLMASDGDASLIVRSYAERMKEEQRIEIEKKKKEDLEIAEKKQSATLLTSGYKIAYGSIPTAPVAMMKEELYRYEEPKLGPSLPSPAWDELEPEGYLNHVRRASPQANAGGYTEHYACLRAVQDFMCSHILVE